MTSLGPSGQILDAMVACSGRIPMISIVMGKVTGISALAVGLSDFVIMHSSYGNMVLTTEDNLSEFIAEKEIKEFSGNAANHFSRSRLRVYWQKTIFQHLPSLLIYYLIFLITCFLNRM